MPWLIDATGNLAVPGAWLIAAALISLAATVVAMPERSKAHLARPSLRLVKRLDGELSVHQRDASRSGRVAERPPYKMLGPC